jgi:hypothetical protein
MVRTVEATVDEDGRVSLLEPIRLPSRRRALVTILEEDAVGDADLAPAQTAAEMAAAHRARQARLAPGEAEYESIDLPHVDDGADW